MTKYPKEFYNKMPTSVPKGYASATGAKLKFQSMVEPDIEIEFMAFLNNFTQNFNSTWNAEPVYGRNDDIATFQGTKRSYSISWTVPAGTIQEAQYNLANCGFLTQMLYPQYNTDNKQVGTNTVSQNALSISKSPLIRLSFANLIVNSNDDGQGLLGYVTSLTWTPTLEMGMFTENQNFYPKVIEISIDFNVLHEHQLGFSKVKDTDGTFGGGIIGFPFKGR